MPFAPCKSFFVLALGLAQQAAAQGAPGSTGPTPAAPTGPTGVPIDGGLAALLAGGVAYGLRRLKRRVR